MAIATSCCRRTISRLSLLGLFIACIATFALPASAAPTSLDQYKLQELDLRGDLVRDYALHPTNPAIVYLIGQSGGVYRSTDHGDTWKPLLQIDGRGIAIDHQHPQTVYAGGLRGLYKSTDGGETWNKVLDAGLRSVGVHPASGVVFGGGNGGHIWRSEDGGKTWTEPKLRYRWRNQ